MSAFHTQSTSSSLSSRKFNLDDKDNSDILVYKLRHGYTISSQKDLCKELDKAPSKLRCSRKPIPRGCSRVDIQTRDLFNEPQRSEYSHYPNARSSLASVGLPAQVYWRRLLMGHFRELYIVSPDNSPDNSSSGSSPNGTFYDSDAANGVVGATAAAAAEEPPSGGGDAARTVD